MRRSTFEANGDRKTRALDNGQALGDRSALGWPNAAPPYIRTAERAADEGFPLIQPAPFLEVAGGRFQHLLQRAVVDPLLEARVACVARRVTLRRSLPRHARPRNPEDAIQDLPVVASWTSLLARSAPAFRQQRPDHLPWRVRKLHGGVLQERQPQRIQIIAKGPDCDSRPLVGGEAHEGCSCGDFLESDWCPCHRFSWKAPG